MVSQFAPLATRSSIRSLQGFWDPADGTNKQTEAQTDILIYRLYRLIGQLGEDDGMFFQEFK